MSQTEAPHEKQMISVTASIYGSGPFWWNFSQGEFWDPEDPHLKISFCIDGRNPERRVVSEVLKRLPVEDNPFIFFEAGRWL
ncbi:hypothetical protein, partial [Deinococcus apachensis]|uniref:hypothetical protein n=1 Tax=Deinococcus apachensis TaxID=309886 RepID=UPI001B7FECF4